jgi:hypothetical protein
MTDAQCVALMAQKILLKAVDNNPEAINEQMLTHSVDSAWIILRLSQERKPT